ncbi:MAG: type II secretion system F family protein [Planctomycetota bacterium]
MASLRFRYRATERATGRTLSGEMAAESAYNVRAGLRRIGLEVDFMEPVDDGTTAGWWAPITAAWEARLRRQRRLAKADLCDGIATLIQAGLPLEQAVTSLLASPTRSADERFLLHRIRDQLREGQPLSAACAQFPGWFDRFDVALLEAGQQAGDLLGTLLGLAQHHQRAGAIGQRLFVALAYPAVLLTAGIAALITVSFTTLPQLTTLITQAKHQPPWLTMQVLGLGQGLVHWWPLVLLGVAAVLFSGRWLIQRIVPTSRLGRWWYGNPLARARSRIRVATLAETLARLRRAGLPLTDALEVAAETITERALAALITESIAAVRKGEDLSAVMARSHLLDPEFAQLLQLGERSGELTVMLERIAERYRRAADRTTERLAALLGPLAIVLLAFLIGVLVIACALPLMQLGDLA